MLYIAKHAALELILPPFSPFLLLLLAAWLRRTSPRLGACLAAIALTTLILSSIAGLHSVSGAGEAERIKYPAPPYPAADAIVVLGGGRYFDAAEYGGDTAGPSTLERVRYAAKLHRETGTPILVSGGRPGQLGSRTEAEIMAGILVDEFRIDVRWREDRSESTRENAMFSAEKLKADHIETIYLVTHASHMARAAKNFEDQGLRVVPMATGYIEPPQLSLLSWFPSFYGMSLTRYWLTEKLAAIFL